MDTMYIIHLDAMIGRTIIPICPETENYPRQDQTMLSPSWDIEESLAMLPIVTDHVALSSSLQKRMHVDDHIILLFSFLIGTRA